uniref:Uncharacterized protein n=1 Tax=Oryza glumipatula TaxID=40148 RepID=A0A0D9ZA58_9ORYZ
MRRRGDNGGTRKGPTVAVERRGFTPAPARGGRSGGDGGGGSGSAPAPARQWSGGSGGGARIRTNAGSWREGAAAVAEEHGSAPVLAHRGKEWRRRDTVVRGSASVPTRGGSGGGSGGAWIHVGAGLRWRE